MNDEQILRSFSGLLRAHRQRAGLTQQHLADLATVSVRAVRNLERGAVRAPRPETVRLLAAGLGLAPSERDALIEAASARPRSASDGAVRYRLDPSPPWAATSAVAGREPEISTLVELLGLPGQRLVTVVGVGGVGKTRLAVEAVTRCTRAHGLPALWLSRAEPGGGAGITSDGDVFPSGSTLSDIASGMLDRPALLALDDLEECGVGTGQVTALMLRCPRLRLLVTAPAPLGLPHEQVLPLAPLPVPCAADEADPAHLARNPAVRLLVTHIRRFDHAFRLDRRNAAVVAELCRALDGMPRSLEYAGSWSLVRSLEQLLDEARSNPFHTPPPPTSPVLPRHPSHGLRRTIARLEPRMRSLLAAVARGAGAWSIGEAASQAGLQEHEATSVLHTLVTLGLLRAVAGKSGERRFVALRQVQHLYTGLPAAVG